MTDNGVARAVVIPSHAYVKPKGMVDTARVNNNIAAYQNSFPDNCAAAIGIAEPSFGEAGLAEISHIGSLGLKGISFHSRFQGVTLGSEWMMRYAAATLAAGLVPFVHTVAEVCDTALWRLESLASRNAGGVIVALDAFGSNERIRELFSVAARIPNVVFDTALAASADPIVRFIEEYGADRVVYGSDQYTARSAADGRSGHVLNGLLKSRLTHREKELVIGGNACRVLGLRGKL